MPTEGSQSDGCLKIFSVSIIILSSEIFASPSPVTQAHPGCVGALRARRSEVACNFGRWRAAGFALEYSGSLGFDCGKAAEAELGPTRS